MKDPVYFLKLELENVRCFGEKAELDLSDGKGNWRQWTVILGDNGTGKTTLLQAIALLEQNMVDYNRVENLPLAKRAVYVSRLDKKIKFKLNEADTKIKGTLNFMDGQTRASVALQELEEFYSDIQTDMIYSNLIIYGYGANRIMNRSTTQTTSKNSETLFDEEAKLINANEWLKDLEFAFATSNDIRTKDFLFRKKEDIKNVLINLLPDIKEIRITQPTIENPKSDIEFLTPYGYWVGVSELSLGYRTMATWMVDLAAKMFERYPTNDSPLAEPAIVLIDEIDLHLHPKWQRKIFGYLSERFPKTQFIVTAHSPLVVQSAPQDANIVLLRKEGDHVVIDNNVQSVHNWRLDQILSSDLFGGIPSRNEEVENELERRKELISKQDLLSEAEKKELDDLNAKADKLPYAESEADIEAKDIIRKAAEYYKKQGIGV